MNEASSIDTTFTPAVGRAPVGRVRTDQAVPGGTRPHASRRSLLSCLAPAALVLASTGAKVAAHVVQPDAELIALCAEMDTMEHRIDAMFDGVMSDMSFEAADAAACIIEMDQRRLLDRICALTPATDEGCSAVARSLALLAPDYGLPNVYVTACIDERLANLLARGMMGRAAA